MAYDLALIKSLKHFDFLSMLHRTSAGFRETELKLFTVMPIFCSFTPKAVTTVIPVAKLPNAFLKAKDWESGDALTCFFSDDINFDNRLVVF